MRATLAEAFAAIFANRLRTVLTVLIIGIGIMALVGVLTSIDGIKFWLRSSFSTLGANAFIVQRDASSLTVRNNGRQQKENPPITLTQARKLQAALANDAVINLNLPLRFNAQAKAGANTTHDNLRLTGTDENGLFIESYDVAQGRGLSREDLNERRRIAVIGKAVAEDLFPYGAAVGKAMYIGKRQYRVAGVLAEKGTLFGGGGDRVIFLPLTTALSDYPGDYSMNISVFVERQETMPLLQQRAQAEMRRIRGLQPGEPDNFSIVASAAFVDNLIDNLAILTLAASLIAAITLLGAGIGLMNILLVSVTERTREIGVRKALGATKRDILRQFLTEAVLICQLGALAGVVLGTLLGNGVGALLDAPFRIPWGWVGLSVFLAFLVGIIAGVYPARKAARQDPIEALRYE